MAPLPKKIREEFRRHGREGGHARAARLTPARRSAIARRAASRRWIRARFGASSFEALGLPGGAMIDSGLDDLAEGRETVASLLVSLAAPRLRREGVPLPAPLFPEPDVRLFRCLEGDNEALAHARYLAYLRELASFANACTELRLAKARRAS